MTSDTRDPRPNSDSASTRLRRSKETILRVWEKKVRQNLPTAQIESTLVLRNALPVFLDRLIDTLNHPDRKREVEEVAEAGREHGQQRATLTEYSLKSMLFEYSHLRQTFIEVPSVEGRLEAKDEVTTHEAIDSAVAEAGAEFIRIQNFNQQLNVENLEMERELREGFVNS